MIKNIIWDFDGTLFDTYPAIVQAILDVLEEKYAIKYDADRVLDMVKKTIDYCIDQISREHKLDKENIRKDIRHQYYEVSAIEEKPFPGVKEVCHCVFENGYNLLVTHREYSSLTRMLEKYNLVSFFHEIISSDDEYPLKPDPTSFNFLINKYNLVKSETLGIGDRVLDIEAAHAAGIPSCYFNPDSKALKLATFNIHQIDELFTMLN